MIGIAQYLPTLARHYSPARGGKSLRPWAWENCVAAYCPALGIQGGTLYDLSGYGNDGTLTNMDPATDWVTASVRGQSCYALDFDGVNDYVNIANNPTLNPSTEITVAAWISRSSDSGGYETVVSNWRDDGVGKRAYNFPIDPKDKISFAVSADGRTNNADVSSTSSIAINTWYHVAGTFDGFRVTIYVNGAVERTTLFSGPIFSNSDAPVRIGAKNTGTPKEFFNGLIDDVRIYNRALSAFEVRTLYEIGPNGPYQFYLPYSVGRVAGGGFQAAWARRQIQIIGGGCL